MRDAIVRFTDGTPSEKYRSVQRDASGWVVCYRDENVAVAMYPPHRVSEVVRDDR